MPRKTIRKNANKLLSGSVPILSQADSKDYMLLNESLQRCGSISTLARTSSVPIPPEKMDAAALFMNLSQPVIEAWLHWVIKLKWHSKHKVSSSRKFCKVTQPGGQLWANILELCIQCHSRNCGYSDGALWFEAIFCEYANYSLAGFVEYGGFEGFTTKKQHYIPKIREELRMLKNFENPYKGDPLRPHIAKLIDYALPLGEAANVFSEKHWKPFIRAFEQFVKAESEDGLMVGIDRQGRVFATTERGGKITLSNPPKKKVIF